MKRLQTWFREPRCDVAVCDFLDAAFNFPARLTIPSVLFKHNVESEIWRRHSATAGNPAKKMMYRTECRKMVRYERAAVRKFQHVIAVSENDRSLMTQWVDGDSVTVVPTGVDLAQYRPDPAKFDPNSDSNFAPNPRAASAPLITFVGAMDWEPNVDGVEYFSGEICPSINAEEPQPPFRIFARKPDPRVQKWASGSIDDTTIFTAHRP